MYISILRIVFHIIHLIGYTDEKALYCTSRDRIASFENGSPFCDIIGMSPIVEILSIMSNASFEDILLPGLKY